jgi:ribosomal protein L29
MTGTDLREKSEAELRELSDESREAMFRMKMELRTGQLDQPGKVVSKRFFASVRSRLPPNVR